MSAAHNIEKSEARHIEHVDMSLTHNTSNLSDTDDDKGATGYRTKVLEEEYVPVGRNELSDALPPQESYEGFAHWDPAMTWTPAEEKAVVRRTDLFLMLCVCLMFIGLQLDRGNLSNALADNFLKDLGVNQNVYNNGTTLQLLAFMLSEFPSQIILARVGFQIWLPFLMVCWSTVSMFQAFMTNTAGFYITRVLIGVFEGGFIPGAVLFCSYFYTSAELAVRLSFFWVSLNIARVLSALLAAGILQMRGLAGGRPGWWFLFLLEGAFTLIIGIFAFCWLPANPTNTKTILRRKGWYTERQEKIMVNRVLRDDPAKGLTALKTKIGVADIKDAWSDKNLWLLVLLGLVAYIPQNPVQGYLTLTLKRLGFSTFDSNMLSIPSAVLQIITMLGLSWSSSYFNERTLHCIFGELWSLPCLIALGTMAPGGKNWERFTLGTLISGYPYFHPIINSWISENAFSVKKRSIQVATYSVVVQWGAIVGSQIFRADDAPWYFRGYKVLIAICCLSLVLFVVNWWYLGHLNTQKERKWAAMSNEEKLAYQADVAAREKDGNRRLDFRFSR